MEVQRRTIIREDRTKGYRFYGMLEKFLDSRGERVKNYANTLLLENPVEGKVYYLGEVTALLELSPRRRALFCELFSQDAEALEGLVGEILALDPKFICGEAVGRQ